MQKYVILIVTTFLTLSLFSQSTIKIDALKYKATYLLTYQSDSSDVNSIEMEEMILLIGPNTSKFLSLGTHLKDSVINNTTLFDGQSINLMNTLGNIPKSKFKEKVFKNYPADKITTTEQVLKDFYQYQEPKELFDWQVKEETQIIAGYDCQKAETEFAGRKYIAWFSFEIPLNDGPYKFNGLPGLIVHIHDTKNQYDYKLTSFKEIEKGLSITMDKKNYITIPKQKLVQLKADFHKNIFKKLAQNGFTVNFDNPAEKREILNKYSKRNNPIELTDQ